MAPHTAVGAAAKPPHALLLCSPTADIASRVCLQAVDEQGRLLATVRAMRGVARHMYRVATHAVVCGHAGWTDGCIVAHASSAGSQPAVSSLWVVGRLVAARARPEECVGRRAGPIVVWRGATVRLVA